MSTPIIVLCAENPDQDPDTWGYPAPWQGIYVAGELRDQGAPIPLSSIIAATPDDALIADITIVPAVLPPGETRFPQLLSDAVPFLQTEAEREAREVQAQALRDRAAELARQADELIRSTDELASPAEQLDVQPSTVPDVPLDAPQAERLTHAAEPATIRQSRSA